MQFKYEGIKCGDVLVELAKKENNQPLLHFCAQILEVFEKNNINGHIIWKR